jgi:hypothetical protein
MQITAKLHAKHELKKGITKNGKDWTMGTIHVKTDGQYPKDIILNCKEDIYNQVEVGSNYTFDVEVSSREYNGKWYTQIQAYKLTKTN